jgi:hypothetical protein
MHILPVLTAEKHRILFVACVVHLVLPLLQSLVLLLAVVTVLAAELSS